MELGFAREELDLDEQACGPRSSGCNRRVNGNGLRINSYIPSDVIDKAQTINARIFDFVRSLILQAKNNCMGVEMATCQERRFLVYGIQG